MNGNGQKDMGTIPARPLAAPGSVAWKINSERVLLLGWSTAILMQFAHPLVAAGVADHSVAVARPKERLRRLHRTIQAMLALTFGPPQETGQATRRINAIHDAVHGRLREPAGIFPAGTRYSAHDPALLLWVHATLLYAFPRTYELYVGPLTAQEKDRYCAEAVGMGPLLGIPVEEMPRSVAELDAYLERMLSSGAIAVGGTARGLAREMLAPSHPRLARPLGPFLGFLTVGLLPPAIRRAYGLRWSRYHEAALRGCGWAVRRLLPLVPSVWRYWPAARAAMTTMAPRPAHTSSNPRLTTERIQEVCHDHRYGHGSRAS